MRTRIWDAGPGWICGSLLVSLGLLLATVFAVGLPGAALAAGATYAACPSFATFQSDVEAVGSGESGTFTFNTASPCLYGSDVTSEIDIHAGATITINGNGDLTIQGGTADVPGDFDLIGLGSGANLTVDGIRLLYGDHGINAGDDSNASTIRISDSRLSSNADSGVADSNGDLTIDASTINDNGFTYSGSGVYVGTGSLTITDSEVNGNAANGAEMISSGPMTLSGSTFQDNGHSDNGYSGIYHGDGDTTITICVISGNGFDGVTSGYIVSGNPEGSGGNVTVVGSTITGNAVDGVFNSNNTLTVSNSLIAENGQTGLDQEYGDVKVTSSVIKGNGLDGGNDGIFIGKGGTVVKSSTVAANGGNGIYAGIVSVTGVTISNSTISGNFLDGILVAEGSATVTSSTIDGNGTFDSGSAGVDTSAGATLTATILMDNTDANCAGAVTDNGYNLSGDTSCNLYGNGSHNGVSTDDLSLQSPADNDGPSVGAPGAQQVLQTMALDSGSIAIDAIPSSHGRCAVGTKVDERGIPRPQGTGCDIGAFEASDQVNLLPGSTTTVRHGFYAVIRIEALSANGQNVSARNLPVTSVELDGPDGQTIPFVYQFQFGRFSGTPGYQLSINTRNLARGSWTLEVRIDGGPVLSTLTFTVV